MFLKTALFLISENTKKKKKALKKLVIFKNPYLSKQMQKVYDKEEFVHVHKFEDADFNRRNDLFHL